MMLIQKEWPGHTRGAIVQFSDDLAKVEIVCGEFNLNFFDAIQIRHLAVSHKFDSALVGVQAGGNSYNIIRRKAGR